MWRALEHDDALVMTPGNAVYIRRRSVSDAKVDRFVKYVCLSRSKEPSEAQTLEFQVKGDDDRFFLQSLRSL